MVTATQNISGYKGLAKGTIDAFYVIVPQPGGSTATPVGTLSSLIAGCASTMEGGASFLGYVKAGFQHRAWFLRMEHAAACRGIPCPAASLVWLPRSRAWPRCRPRQRPPSVAGCAGGCYYRTRFFQSGQMDTLLGNVSLHASAVRRGLPMWYMDVVGPAFALLAGKRVRPWSAVCERLPEPKKVRHGSRGQTPNVLRGSPYSRYLLYPSSSSANAASAIQCEFSCFKES